MNEKEQQTPVITGDPVEDFELEDGDENFMDEDASLDEIVNHHVKKANAEMNRLMSKMDSRIQDHENRIANLERLAMNESQPSAKRSGLIQESEATGLDRFLDVTLGTTGRALHAVVDTMAFVGESAVDIVTLGRARVNRQ